MTVKQPNLHHTPGPWSFAHHRVGVGYCTQVLDADGQPIATLDRDIDELSDLIAAARGPSA